MGSRKQWVIFQNSVNIFWWQMSENLTLCFLISAVEFFNQINLLYGTITEFCTEDSCPIMSAGPKYEYHWADGHTVKKPIKCSAPKYIDYLMTWVQDQKNDETLFPSKIGKYYVNCYWSIILKSNSLWRVFALFYSGVPFPKNFLSIAKTILKRLFRVYAHIYHQHFSEVVQLGEEAHLNTSFKHFIFFVQVPRNYSWNRVSWAIDHCFLFLIFRNSIWSKWKNLDHYKN